MKLSTISAFSLLAAGAASAQGIFNIVPNDDATESLPLKYSVSATLGYDDNVTPTRTGSDQTSTFGRLDLGVDYVNITPQTNFNLNASVGIRHYFDDVDDVSESQGNGRIALNIAHRVSERLRLVTRNYVNYGLEADYRYDAPGDGSLEEFLFISTDNAIGYKWTDRLATYSGVRYDSISYEDDFRNDVTNLTFYNQFRYIGSPSTVYTLDYRYRLGDVDGGRDSDNHFVLLGIEKRISETAVFLAKAGAQFRDVDGGESSTSPFVELGYRSKVNEQFNVRANLRYGVEDYGTVFSNALGTTIFDTSQTLRIGIAADYNLSPTVILTGGVNYIHTDFEDGTFNNVSTGDNDLDLINLYVGVTYRINTALSANATYNYTDSSSDETLSRDYDRSRFQLGLTYQF